jgi:hypothetical protein
MAQTPAATRGIEIHQILATYINHLARTRRATDLESFDALMKGASIEAREVLEKFRDNHSFDPEKILSTELHIALDQDFHPVGDSEDEWQTPEYEGTLDLVMSDPTGPDVHRGNPRSAKAHHFAFRSAAVEHITVFKRAVFKPHVVPERSKRARISFRPARANNVASLMLFSYLVPS